MGSDENSLNKLGLSAQESSEIYGFDTNALSPHHNAHSERPSFSMAVNSDHQKWSRQSSIDSMHFQLDDPFEANKSRQEVNKSSHLPQDSFATISPMLKKQITANIKPRMHPISEQKTSSNEHDDPWKNIKVPGRRNTIERIIEKQENATKDIIISEQQTEILTPGDTPLPAILNNDQMNQKFSKEYAKILKKKATNYNESVVYNESDLQKINDSTIGDSDYHSNEDDDTFHSPDDYNDIYGQYGDNKDALIMTSKHSKNPNGSLSSRHSSRHSGNSSIQSDGYMDLTDTMKISREQFQELRQKHQEEIENHPIGHLLNQIHETQSIQFEDDEMQKEFVEHKKK